MTLAERCAKAPGFRWMAGMAAINNGVKQRVAVDDEVYDNLYLYGIGRRFPMTECLPDIDDPATIACIQWLARERHGDLVCIESDTEIGTMRKPVFRIVDVRGTVTAGATAIEAWVNALEEEPWVREVRPTKLYSDEYVMSQIMPLGSCGMSRIEIVQEDNDEFRAWASNSEAGIIERAYGVGWGCSCVPDFSTYPRSGWDVLRKGEWSDEDGGDCETRFRIPSPVDLVMANAIHRQMVKSEIEAAWIVASILEETRPWVKRENDEYRPLVVYVGRSIWDSPMDAKNPRNQCDSGWRLNDCFNDYLGAFGPMGGDCQSEAA